MRIKFTGYSFIPNVILFIALLGLLYHLFQFDGLPFINAIFENNYDFLVEYRRSLTADYPKVLAYFMGFSLKAMFPSLLFYYAHKEKKIFWILYAVVYFYALNFLQKSLILPFALPVLVLFIFRKKWINSLLVTGSIGLFIFGMSWVMNPSVKSSWTGTAEKTLENSEVNLKGPIMNKSAKDSTINASKLEKKNISEAEQKKTKLLNRIKERQVKGYHKPRKDSNVSFPLLNSIVRRVFLTPGKMVSEWFRCVPEHKPFIGVQGYNFFSPITGKPFIKYSKELYPIIHPEWYKRGYRGNVNAASFMYDYVAFGAKGLVLSGFILALLFVFIESLFSSFLIKVSFNLYYVFFLSSTALGITLFSGGWGLMILIYFLLKDFLKLP